MGIHLKADHSQQRHDKEGDQCPPPPTLAMDGESVGHAILLENGVRSIRQGMRLRFWNDMPFVLFNVLRKLWDKALHITIEGIHLLQNPVIGALECIGVFTIFGELDAERESGAFWMWVLHSWSQNAIDRASVNRVQRVVWKSIRFRYALQFEVYNLPRTTFQTSSRSIES